MTRDDDERHAHTLSCAAAFGQAMRAEEAEGYDVEWYCRVVQRQTRMTVADAGEPARPEGARVH